MDSNFQFSPTTDFVNNKSIQSHMFHRFAGDSSPVPEIPYEVESPVSDCESGTSTSSSCRRRRRRIFGEGVAVEILETERSNELICRRFLTGVGDRASVVAVHRRNWSENSFGHARVQAFQVHANALQRKYGGSPNVKFCWYGGDKDRIQQILNHGFSFQDLQMNDNGAVILSPDNSPSQSVEDSGEDEDGLRHVLLCRVLLGRSELVHPGSNQSHPSSDKFDSGVDSYDNPKKYLIWSTHMNTHILPEFVVSFKIKPAHSPSKGDSSMNNARIPTSPWISFPALISILARILPKDAISLINKFHKDYKERRIQRAEMIQKVRQITGDNLLIAVVKSYKGRKEPRNHANN